MSATDETKVIEEPGGACPRCGAPLRPDQDWCLKCGAAVTTRIEGASGWRTPVAIVGVVLCLATAGLVFAFLELSDDAEQVAQAPTPTATPTAAVPTPSPTATVTPSPTSTPSPSPTPGAVTGPTGSLNPSRTPTPGSTQTPGSTTTATPTPSSGSGTFASWPAGKTAYTVILESSTTRAGAEKRAKEIQAQGRTVGILDSDDYSSLRPGYHVVFSGQYDTLKQAQSAADGFESIEPDAYAKQVKP